MLLAVLFLVPVKAEAATVIDSDLCGGNLTWTLTSDGVLTITGKGEMYNRTYAPWYSYRETITSVVLQNGITTIGDHAFQGCIKLTGITIPTSVTRIGYAAFESCEGLVSITIPDSVTDIGEWVFANCESLTDVTLPEGIKVLNERVFSLCRSLEKIMLPESVTSIGDLAFYQCESLESITFPESVTDIGELAFAYGGLTSITFTGDAPTFGASAFAYLRVDVYYPTSEANWTEQVRQSYGAMSITWIPVAGRGVCGNNLSWMLTEQGTLTISGAGTMADYSAATAPWYDNRLLIVNVVFENGTKSIGDYAFTNCSNLENITLPDAVTSIGDSAFSGCETLTSITIPEAVTKIGSYAFKNCSKLQTIVFMGNAPSFGNEPFYALTTTVYYPARTGWSAVVGSSYGGHAVDWYSILSTGDCGEDMVWLLTSDGVLTIKGNGAMSYFGDEGSAPWYGYRRSITSIVIDEGVTSVTSYAFYDCYYVNSATIPSSLTNIYRSAFDGCYPEEVYISDLSAWCNLQLDNSTSNPFQGTPMLYLNGEIVTDLVIPDDVTQVRDYAFSGCESIISVTVPGHVNAIGWNAFKGCFNLTQVTVQDGVQTIGGYAFAHSEYLETVQIADSVSSIGVGALEWCNDLTSVTLSQNITEIPSNMFNGCDKLADIQIPDGVVKIGAYAFYNCGQLTQVVIPDGVTQIGMNAFYGCDNLRSIAIPESVTNIGDYAFYSCGALTAVTLPNNLGSIGKSLFSYCSSLQSIKIPENVTTIGSYAFQSCNSLTTITIPSGVTSIGMKSFGNCGSLTEVIFEGDAPVLGENFCNGITLTAYYPALNRTWTTDVMQNYGGTITWKPYGVLVDMSGASMTLGDDLTLKFYVAVDTSIAADAYMQITVGSGEAVRIKVSEAEQDTDGSYIFTADVAAAQMMDAVTLQLIAGEEISQVATYSVRQYADAVLADETLSEYHALVTAMLNYGAAAQTYFGYNTENLVNVGITAEPAAVPTAATTQMLVSGSVDGIDFYGATLVFGARTAVRYYFAVTGDIGSYSFSAGNHTYQAVEKNGLCYVEVPGVNPQDLDETVTLTVSNGTSTQTVSYSPMTYIVNMYYGNGSENLKMLLQALYSYYLAAEAVA